MNLGRFPVSIQWFNSLGLINLMSLITNPVDVADSIALPRSQPLHERKSIRQFVKFCIVGASSTVISFTIFNMLLQKYDFPLVPAVTVAFLVSVINGFLWNRHWTFKEAKHQSAH